MTNEPKKTKSNLIKTIIFVSGLLTRTIKKIDRNLYIPIAIIIGSIIIAQTINSTVKKTFQTNTTSTQKTPSSQLSPSLTTSPLPSAPTGPRPETLNPTDHIRGSKDAKIVLIEYSDLECPFCKEFHPTLKKILESYNGQVAWVFRHFPLDSIHPKADKEAEAAECAFEQAGDIGFWNLVDKIYEVTPSNNRLEASQIPTLADQVGLNGTMLQTCINSGKMAAKVQSQFQNGLSSGVTGTPGTVILNTKNGRSTLISGALPFDTFKRTIDEFINAQ